MPKRLPTRLRKEPLLEAVCELRVSPVGALHTVLPGLLYAGFRDQISSLEQLPAGAIPDHVRSQDANLAFASVVRLGWRDYFILIGPRSIAIACRLPYPKWHRFKADTLELFRFVINSRLVKGIDRYSVKYVNFFPSPGGKSGYSGMLDWSVRVGPFSLGNESTQLRLEIPHGEMLTVVSIVTAAMVQSQTEPPRNGGIVDIDTVCDHVTNDLVAFESELETRLDNIRQVNKQAFFDCLNEAAIELMEPEYDDDLSATRH